LYKAKQLKDVGYKYIWPKDGKVFVRKSDSGNDKTVQVFTFADVEKLMAQSGSAKRSVNVDTGVGSG